MLGINFTDSDAFRSSDFAGAFREFIINAAARMNLPLDATGDLNAVIDSLAVAVADQDAKAAQIEAERRASADKAQRLTNLVAEEKANIAAKLKDLREQLMGEIKAKYDSLMPFVIRREIPPATANAQLQSMITNAKATYSNTAQTLVTDAQNRIEQEKVNP